MRFTTCQPHHNASLIHFSPGATFVVSYLATPSSLVLRSADTLTAIRSWSVSQDDEQESTASPLEQVCWSADGQFLLITGGKSNRESQRLPAGEVQVLIVDPRQQPSQRLSKQDRGVTEAVAHIKAAATGLTKALWGPSGAPSSVVTFSPDDLIMTIHCLVDGSRAIIPNVKRGKYLEHPTDSSCFAVLTRDQHTSIESINIYRYIDQTTKVPSTYTEILSSSNQENKLSSNWHLESSFATKTNDAIDFSWSPDGQLICIWEGPAEYKLHLYTISGYLRGTFLIDPDPHRGNRGRPTLQFPTSTASSTAIVAQKEISEDHALVAGGGLGIRHIDWQPVSNESPVDVGLISVGGWDENVYILSPYTDHPMSQTWSILSSAMGSSSSIDLSGKTLQLSSTFTIFREPRNWHQSDEQIAFETTLQQSNITIPSLRPDWDKVNPRVGIHWLQWDPTGQWLGIRNESMPSTIFIYKLPASINSKEEKWIPPKHLPLVHSVIFSSAPIVACIWRPGTRRSSLVQLNFITSKSSIYTWQSKFDQSTTVTGTRLPNHLSPSSIKFSSDGKKLLIIQKEDSSGSGQFCVALQDDDDSDMTDDITHD
ncbi:unnamed protein product [Sympodiomycopsis kandeliae]